MKEGSLVMLKYERRITMKSDDNLQKQVENNKTMEESKELVKEEGMELTDDELEAVSGGVSLQHIKQQLGM